MKAFITKNGGKYPIIFKAFNELYYHNSCPTVRIDEPIQKLADLQYDYLHMCFPISENDFKDGFQTISMSYIDDFIFIDESVYSEALSEFDKDADAEEFVLPFLGGVIGFDFRELLEVLRCENNKYPSFLRIAYKEYLKSLFRKVRDEK